MLRSTFLVFCLLVGFHLSAQELQGLLVNERTGEPIAFASITKEDGYPVTVSNRKGAFAICAEKGMKIKVSVPGFVSGTFDLASWPEGRQALLSLKEAPNVLKPVGEEISGNELMVRVYETALDHYQLEAVSLGGWFRESSWLPETGALLMRQEASVAVSFPKLKKLPPSQRFMSAGISKEKQTDAPIEPGTVTLTSGFEFRNDSLIRQVQGTVRSVPGLPVGKYVCTDLDVIRNPIYFMGGHDLKDYEFEWQKTVSYGGEPVAVVRFTPREGSLGAWFHGTLYIDLFNSVIIRANYENSSYAVDGFNNSMPFPEKVMQDCSYDLGYTKWQGQWYLQFAAVTTNTLELKNVQNVRTYSDFVLNFIQPKNRIPAKVPEDEAFEKVETEKGAFPWKCSNLPPLEQFEMEAGDSIDLASDLVLYFPDRYFLNPTLVVPRKDFELRPYYYDLGKKNLDSPVYVDAPEAPVVAILEAGTQEIPVYLERGQSTSITITADEKGNPVFNIYEGKSKNNTLLVSFERLKSRLLLSLRNAWKVGGSEEFFKMARVLQGGLLDHLRRKQETDSISPVLARWMETEATYMPASWLYTYHLHNSPLAPLPDDWQDWLSTIKLDNPEAADHPAYQYFVLVKLKYEALQLEAPTDNLYPLQKQLELARQTLSGRALENISLLLLQNSLRCNTPAYELDMATLTEPYQGTDVMKRITRIRNHYGTNSFLEGLPLMDVATRTPVNKYSGNAIIPSHSLLVFWDCKCGKCDECGLSKDLVDPRKRDQSAYPVFIAPLWFDELCEAKQNNCKLFLNDNLILSVYFQYLPEFMAKMPFVELPHSVMLGRLGSVSILNYQPDANQK